MRKKMEGVLFSFPVQLLFHHLKRNLPLVIIWVLFIAVILGGIGNIYGIHYLYLDPEYGNKVGFASFFLVGLGYGNFTMAFHITSYILDSHRFAFVGILERAFAKYSINNSIIPLVSLIIYIGLIIRFQINNEFTSGLNLMVNILGLLSGIVVMLALFYIYFKFTNKDIFKYLSGSVDKRLRKSRISRDRVMSRYKETRQRKYTVHTYLDLRLRTRSCQNLLDFYDKEAVLKVFDQNHLNSVVVELGIIILIIFLGTFMDNPYLQLPAAASCLLIAAIIIMLVGAVSYWFRGWGMVFVLGLFVVVNTLVKVGVIKGTYPAIGLDYTGDKAVYSLDNLRELNTHQQFREDKQAALGILDNWKAKQKEEKPKAVFMCVSGGGQRAALWTVNSLIHADSLLDGKLMDRTVMITGASGGVIGAAYYRQLELMEQSGEPLPGREEQLDYIGRDNLNAIIFSLLVNDAFFRVRNVEYEGRKYIKDRGYVFEQNLSKNLQGVFPKKLVDYRESEQAAEIPLLLMSPVIANDGRKLYVSAQPVSYMNVNEEVGNGTVYKMRGVDFNQLFEAQGSEDLSFLSALRMSASFPYITPTMTLPSEPPIEIMDAGISDNFGVGDAIRFIQVFQEWFEANTSGIVLLVIRDTRKLAPIEAQTNPSLFQRLTYPIASVYNNLANIQDITNDTRIESAKKYMKIPVSTVELEYNTYTNISEEYLLTAKETERKQMERASLSWHLTTREKQNIIQNILLPNNQAALRKLKELMEAGPVKVDSRPLVMD